MKAILVLIEAKKASFNQFDPYRTSVQDKREIVSIADSPGVFSDIPDINWLTEPFTVLNDATVFAPVHALLLPMAVHDELAIAGISIPEKISNNREHFALLATKSVCFAKETGKQLLNSLENRSEVMFENLKKHISSFLKIGYWLNSKNNNFIHACHQLPLAFYELLPFTANNSIQEILVTSGTTE
ncbi:MAG: hypothetical protein QNJ54_35900 [Prochloraceae cyanobacterium]|nr:hypothetical protein [Prochloraceae cyanobacterium]